MKFRSIAVATISAVALTACASLHNFDKDVSVAGVTVTPAQQCHAGNDAIGAGAGGLILGPIGFVGGLIVGEYMSHKHCK